MLLRKAEKILKEIESRSRIMITSHVYPDGDSIGSSLALMHVLEKMGKEVYVVFPHSFGSKYLYLPGADKALIFPDKPDVEVEVVFVLDAGSLKRLRGVADLINNDMTVVNIDHHVSNDGFGNIQLIDPGACSTAEILYHLFVEWKTEITSDIAACLYAGISTDTGRFSFDNTTAETLRIASDLVKAGADPSLTYKRIYQEKSLGEFMLLSRALASLKVSDCGRWAWIELTAKDFEETGTEPIDTSDYAEIPRSIQGVEVGMFFREEGASNFKGSLRSNNSFNVSRFASTFGGGGHPQAAGFTIFAPIIEARTSVLFEIQKNFDNYFDNE